MASNGLPHLRDMARGIGRRLEQEEEEDKIASPANLWLPLTVVKRHRTKATILWVALTGAFIAYVAFIVWDAVKSRSDPATSFEFKREVFSFPDIAVCLNPYEGCLADDLSACLDDSFFIVTGQQGFLEDELEADEASLEIEEAFGNCKVLPASKLTVNQTGVDNGDVENLYASFVLGFFDDPYGEYDPVEEGENGGSPLFWQFVNVYFLDVDKGVEAAGEVFPAAKLPYERLSPTTSGTLVGTTSLMVLELTEFKAISATSGKTKEIDQTYTQSSTSATFQWYYPDLAVDISLLWFDVYIPKFEYTSIEEVDPVDAWAIIGAIGGVWQFVVIAFGLFFVFSEKQLPDKKMRNFRKTVTKPIVIVNRRFSSITSSRGSTTEDIEIDASDEDLPIEWVKKQRKNGTTYYYNTFTGVMRENSPHEADVVAGAPVAPPGRSSIARVFTAAHNRGISAGSHGANSTKEPGDDSLPPGWIERTDAKGKLYYIDTIMKTTQWDRPRQGATSSRGPGVQAIDVPIRRGSSSSSERNSNSNTGHVDRAAVQSSTNRGIAASRESALGTVPAAPSGPPPPAPDGAGKISKLPSYRTMLSMPGNSVSGGSISSGAGASAGTAAPIAGVGGGGGRYETTGETSGSVGGGCGESDASLLPGWERRTTAKGKTYYAHAATKVTQWHAPCK